MEGSAEQSPLLVSAVKASASDTGDGLSAPYAEVETGPPPPTNSLRKSCKWPSGWCILGVLALMGTVVLLVPSLLGYTEPRNTDSTVPKAADNDEAAVDTGENVSSSMLQVNPKRKHKIDVIGAYDDAHDHAIHPLRHGFHQYSEEAETRDSGRHSSKSTGVRRAPAVTRQSEDTSTGEQEEVTPSHRIPPIEFSAQPTAVGQLDNGETSPAAARDDAGEDIACNRGKDVERSVVRSREDPAWSNRGSAGSHKGETDKPNVFFFMIDDMGWNDIGYQSTDLSSLTPNLDKLAASGIKLNNYHSVSVCTPARTSLMTGRYPVRYGMQHGVVGLGAPWGLPLTEKILPQYLNDAGYESHMVGKWHMGSHREEFTPYRRGFDTFLGYLSGQEDYWTHKNTEGKIDGKYFYDFGFGNATSYYQVASDGPYTRMDQLNDDGRSSYVFSKRAGADSSKVSTALEVDESVPGKSEFYDELDAESVDDEALMEYTGRYSEDVFISRATRVVNAKTPWDQKPLFMYISHQSVHSLLAKPPGGGMSPAERDLLAAVESTSKRRRMFAKTLLYLDKQIGNFLDVLEAGGWMENSIIVVASDNGGCPFSGGSNYPLRGAKGSYFEGGTKVPAFVYSKSHIPEEVWGTTYDGMVHVTDWLPTLATAVGSILEGRFYRLDLEQHVCGNVSHDYRTFEKCPSMIVPTHLVNR